MMIKTMDVHMRNQIAMFLALCFALSIFSLPTLSQDTLLPVISEQNAEQISILETLWQPIKMQVYNPLQLNWQFSPTGNWIVSVAWDCRETDSIFIWSTANLYRMPSLNRSQISCGSLYTQSIQFNQNETILGLYKTCP